MAYGLKQEQRLSQKLLLTPQLRLAIKLLQLSRMELVDAIREEIEQNPVLEDSAPDMETAAGEDTENAASKMDESWQNYLEGYGDDSSQGMDFGVEDGDDEDFVEKAATSGRDLRGYLLWQIHYCLNEESALAEYIIECIEDDGYLRAVDAVGLTDKEIREKSIAEISAATGADAAAVEDMIGRIQALDPPGVGAMTLRECLRIQARRLPARDIVAEEIIDKHLDLLGSRNYKAIASAMELGVERVVEAGRVISDLLTPVPGSGFGKSDERLVIPDIYIKKVEGEYVVMVNDDGLPKLKVSAYYRAMLKKDADGSGEARDARGYVRERMKAAMWFIKSVHQRQNTIKKVAESIVKFQTDFLDLGLKFLKPMILKDVAEDIGMHESTVSRVTTNKYVDTPRGVFELKYFFTSGSSSVDGDVSSEYVKERLREIIGAEDRARPLSDQQLTEELKKSGIELARRTVAKYREELGLLSTSGRRERQTK
ncbi:MAG: RNA polymerase factor sigma-54 [Deltaproteobacteria bacterium]|nr:RNA polymerase factor sigma-54 [Deltaproteobacteria bacterium]